MTKWWPVIESDPQRMRDDAERWLCDEPVWAVADAWDLLRLILKELPSDVECRNAYSVPVFLIARALSNANRVGPIEATPCPTCGGVKGERRTVMRDMGHSHFMGERCGDPFHATAHSSKVGP